MDSRLATSLEGRYTIDREIGRGGMATVYLARDVRHSRTGEESRAVIVLNWGRELAAKRVAQAAR